MNYTLIYNFNTRNNNQLLLQHPGEEAVDHCLTVGANSYGRCAFSYTAPTVWN